MASKTYAVLDNGRLAPLETFDSTFIPSSDEKDALVGTDGSPSTSNKFVTNSDSRMTDARTPTSHNNTYHSETYITSAGVTYENLDGNGDVGTGASTVAAGNDSRFPTSDEKAALAGEGTPSALNKFTTKSYVDALVNGADWQDSVDHTVDYVKTTAGAPSGTGASGEKCLNTNEAKLYTYTASWDAGVAVSTDERFVHKDTGVDTTGNSGTHTASNKIYDYNGSTFDETVASEGMAFWAEDDDALFIYNGSAYVAFGSVSTHNNLSGLQGGTASEYYHITANQEAGLDAATAITGSNPPLTKADRDRVPVRFDFAYYGGLAAAQTDVELYEGGMGIHQRVLLPSAGSIVKTTYQSTGARTAGTLTAEPTLDGTKVTENGLDLVIDDDPTNDAKAEVAPDTTNLTFTAGQKLGLMATTDASWANGSGDIVVSIYVVFDT